MNKIVKKYGIPIILVASLVFGIGSHFSRTRTLKELTFKDGLYQQEVISNAAVVKDKEDEIRKLQSYIAVVEEEKLDLVKAANVDTVTLRTVRRTRTALDKARETLTDKDAIIYNQDLQIQEFVKAEALEDERYSKIVRALLASEKQMNAAIAMSKDYYDLWQKEKALHKLSADAYADYKSKVVSRQFKITVKGIGEKILYAAAGYGLGRITG